MQLPAGVLGHYVLDSRASWGSAMLMDLGGMSHRHSSPVCGASSALAGFSAVVLQSLRTKFSSIPKVSFPVLNEAVLFLPPSYFPCPSLSHPVLFHPANNKALS